MEFYLNFKVPFPNGFSKTGIKSTLHFNNGDHHAQNPNASVEVKEGQKKAKEAKDIATMVQNVLNHSPLFMPSSTERMSDFCASVAARRDG